MLATNISLEDADQVRHIDLNFADDVVLFESTVDRANALLKKLDEHAKSTVLENTKKTKHLRLNINDARDLILDNKSIKQVDDFKYFGSQIATTSSDVSQRIAKGWLAFWQLDNIWKASNIDLDLKISISAAVISILLYGYESWVITPMIENQLNTFEPSVYELYCDSVSSITSPTRIYIKDSD